MEARQPPPVQPVQHLLRPPVGEEAQHAVPAAFFEEAVGARVARKDGAVEVLPPESAATPETQPQTATE